MSYFKESLSRALAAAVQSVVETRRARWELGRNLEEAARQGQENTPQYQQMRTLYEQMSAGIDQALAELQERKPRMDAELGPTNPLAGFRNYLGLQPLGASTLGPKGAAPGIVSSGPDVIKLQKFFKAYGFFLTATGEFDVQTRLVLQKFQEEHALPAPTESIVGVETRHLVNDMIEGK